MDRKRQKERAPRSGPSQRQQRVGELLRHTLSARLMRGELPSLQLYDCPLLVGEVRMTPDLRWARVYISFAEQGDASMENQENKADKEEQKRAVLKELRTIAPELQRICAAPLALKFTPKLAFQWDDLSERAAKIEGLLKRTQEARQEAKLEEAKLEESRLKSEADL